MSNGNRSDPVLKRTLTRVLVSGLRPATAVLAAVIVTLMIAFLPAHPASAQEVNWVLTQTLVNPENIPLEYYGGPKTPGFFDEERFTGMFLIYQPTATSFTVQDRWQDREYVAWDVTITCDFDAPEDVLVPGESYEMTAAFSHSGMSNEPSPGARFSYASLNAGIDSADTLAYFPWSTDFNGVASKTWTFTAPTASAGATLQISGGLWNAAPCQVIWEYEARTVASETTTSSEGLSTSTSALVDGAVEGGQQGTDLTQLPEWANQAVEDYKTHEERFVEDLLANVPESLDWLKPKPVYGEEMQAVVKPGPEGPVWIYSRSAQRWRVANRAGESLEMGDIVVCGDDSWAEIISREGGYQNRAVIADNASLRLPLPKPTHYETDWPKLWHLYSGAVLIKRQVLDQLAPRPSFMIGDWSTITGCRSELVFAHDLESGTTSVHLIEGEVDYYSTLSAEFDSGMITTGETLVVEGDGTKTVGSFEQSELESVLQTSHLDKVEPLDQQEVDRLFADEFGSNNNVVYGVVFGVLGALAITVAAYLLLRRRRVVTE